MYFVNGFLSLILFFSLFATDLSGSKSFITRRGSYPRYIKKPVRRRDSNSSTPPMTPYSPAEKALTEYFNLNRGQYIENINKCFLPYFKNEELNYFIEKYAFEKNIFSEKWLKAFNTEYLKIFEDDSELAWQIIFISAFIISTQDYKNINKYKYIELLNSVGTIFFTNLRELIENGDDERAELIFLAIEKSCEVAKEEELPLVENCLFKKIARWKETLIPFDCLECDLNLEDLFT